MLKKMWNNFTKVWFKIVEGIIITSMLIKLIVDAIIEKMGK